MSRDSARRLGRGRPLEPRLHRRRDLRHRDEECASQLGHALSGSTAATGEAVVRRALEDTLGPALEPAGADLTGAGCRKGVGGLRSRRGSVEEVDPVHEDRQVTDPEDASEGKSDRIGRWGERVANVPCVRSSRNVGTDESQP